MRVIDAPHARIAQCGVHACRYACQTLTVLLHAQLMIKLRPLSGTDDVHVRACRGACKSSDLLSQVTLYSVYR